MSKQTFKEYQGCFQRIKRLVREANPPTANEK